MTNQALPPELERWTIFSDKELRAIEIGLRARGTSHAHSMLAQITLEVDRRVRADAAGKPRAEFERSKDATKS